jgi:hypothetical protein
MMTAKNEHAATIRPRRLTQFSRREGALAAGGGVGLGPVMNPFQS